MLTRHLYRIDEVCAALMYEIRRGRPLEVAFWTQELIDSELFDELFKTLRIAFLWTLGVGRLEILRQLILLQETEEAISDDQVVGLACAMAAAASSSRDASVFALLSYGATDLAQPDRVNKTPSHIEDWIQHECTTDAEAACLRACWQGKARLAFDLARTLFGDAATAERFMTLLKGLQVRKFGSATLGHCLEILEKEEFVWPARAAMIAALCLTHKQLCASMRVLSTDIPVHIQKERGEWKAAEGRRRRRVFPIPKECLYWITKRGRTSYQTSNLKEVYCGTYKPLLGCAFWDRVLDETKPWESDERKEVFWDTYFPDDIPDEWSLADQQKSHGEGVLGPDETANVYRYIRRTLTGLPCRVCWQGVYDGLQRLERLWQAKAILDYEHGWDELYVSQQKQWKDIVATWNFVPVERRLLVTQAVSEMVVVRPPTAVAVGKV